MSGASGGDGYDAYVGRIARGAGISSVGQGVGRMANYALQVALARMYGPALLGLYVLGATVAAVASVLAQFGLDNGVVRYVARHRSDGDEGRVRGTIMLSLATTFFLGIALASVVFFGAGFLAVGVFGDARLEGVFRVFAVSVPFLAVMSVALWATQGFQTVKYATYVREMIQPLANLALVVVFYVAAAGILGAAFAYLLSMAVGAALSLFYLRRIFPRILDRQTPAKFEGRELFSSSAPMLVVNVMDNMNVWAAVAILGLFASAGDVGVYNAAARTAGLSMLILAAFKGIFSPMISELHRRGESYRLGSLYKDVTLWTFTGSLVAFCLTALLARDIMAVFGEEFIPGWPALVVIAVAQLFNSSVGLTNSALAMTGHQKIVMAATLVSAAALVAASLVLVPLYGLMGAAVATSASVVFANTMTLLAVRSRLGFWPYSWGYLKPIAAGAVAALAVYAAEVVVSPTVGVSSIAALTPIFVAAFGATLVALGLGPGEKRLLASLWETARRVFRA